MFFGLPLTPCGCPHPDSCRIAAPRFEVKPGRKSVKRFDILTVKVKVSGKSPLPCRSKFRAFPDDIPMEPGVDHGPHHEASGAF